MKHLFLFVFIVFSCFAQAQKPDSVQKAPGNILEAKYNQWIQTGDEQFQKKNYKDAMQAYWKALELKPDEKYPKNKIAECEAHEKLFTDLILMGDDFFKKKDYVSAQKAYQQAASLMPGEQYPKDKIAECNK